MDNSKESQMRLKKKRSNLTCCASDYKNFNKICYSIVVHHYKLWKEAYHVEVPKRLYHPLCNF